MQDGSAETLFIRSKAYAGCRFQGVGPWKNHIAMLKRGGVRGTYQQGVIGVLWVWEGLHSRGGARRSYTTHTTWLQSHTEAEDCWRHIQQATALLQGGSGDMAAVTVKAAVVVAVVIIVLLAFSCCARLFFTLFLLTRC